MSSASAAAPEPDRNTTGSGAAQAAEQARQSAADQAGQSAAHDAGRSDADHAGRGAADRTSQSPHADDAVPPPLPSGKGHADFLVTSEERDAAEARLRQAVADDVVSLEEFGDRMRILLAARTRGELHAATVGLPADTRAADGARGAGQPQRASRPQARRQPRPATERVRNGGSAIAIMSTSKVEGRWRPDESTRAVAVMGDAVIDLQGVEFSGDELVISAVAVMGEVVIIVPEGVGVDMHGASVMGDRTIKIDQAIPADAPVVRIDGLAIMGDVIARHPKAKERYVPTDGRGAFADRVPLLEADEVAAVKPRNVRARTTLSKLTRWGAGALAAIALAIPVGWTMSADDAAMSVFGSATQTVSAAQLADGEATAGALVAFGSVTIRVPEGVNVERDGVVIFGSTECDDACVPAAADAPTVHVRTFGAFGSVEIVPIPASG